MFKLFSVEEANRMIPVLESLLGNLQDAVSDVVRLREEFASLEPGSVAGRNKVQELAFVLGDAQATKAELDRLGVLVQDVDAGLVDLPSQLGAEVVYLSWEKGQDSITHYHRLSEDARRPLHQLRPEANFARKSASA